MKNDTKLYILPVVVANNTGKLMSVCRTLRPRFENVVVVVASSSYDRQNTVNKGRLKAIQATETIGATLLFPELCKACEHIDHNDRIVCRRRCARA